MRSIPLGYKIRNGKAVIDQKKADVVKQLFSNYLSGMALVSSAKKAGLYLTHSSVKRILFNKHYLGDSFYPALIDQDTFKRTRAEWEKRKVQKRLPLDYEVIKIPHAFHFKKEGKVLEDPKKQAEHMYALLESEDY